MRPHFSNGREIPLAELNSIQRDFALEWSLTREMDVSRRLYCWGTFFAKAVSDLCREHDVPVDVFNDVFSDFAERVTQHIDRLKWYLSEPNGDIGLIQTAQYIDIHIQKINEESVELDMTFPFVDHLGPEGHESLILPVVHLSQSA